MVDEKTVSLRDILSTLFKNKFAIIIIFVSAMACSLLYCTFKEPIYQAESRIMVKIGREKLSSLSTMSSANYNILIQERIQDINNEIEILKGSYIIDKVLPKLKAYLKNKKKAEKSSFKGKIKSFFKEFEATAVNLVKKPLSLLGLSRNLSKDKALDLALIDSFKVDYLEQTDIIQLSFESPDRDFAAFAVNVFAKEYIARHARIYQTAQSYNLYLDQMNLYKDKLDATEKDILHLYQTEKVANIAKQKVEYIDEISRLEEKLREATEELLDYKFKYSEVEGMLAAKNSWIETPNIGKLGVVMTDLSQLDKLYFDMMAEKNILLLKFMPSAQEVRDINSRIAAVKKEKGSSLLNLIRFQINTLTAKKAFFEKALSEKKSNLERLNAVEIRMGQLIRQRNIISDKYMSYSSKAENLRISNALDKNKILSVEVISPAIPPFLPVAPKKELILTVTALVALFLGLAYAIIREFFNHTFREAHDMEAYLDVPLLATIPFNEELSRRM